MRPPSLLQPKEQPARAGGEGDAADAGGRGNRVTARPPIRGGRLGVLLQGIAPGAGPGHDDAAAEVCNRQGRHSRRLHHGNEAPETARQAVAPARHRPARIRLTDGAGDLVSRAGAGPTAAGDLIPVNGKGLGVDAEFVRWLQAPQKEAGVFVAVSRLVDQYSDNPAAQEIAGRLGGDLTFAVRQGGLSMSSTPQNGEPALACTALVRRHGCSKNHNLRLPQLVCHR